MRRELAGARQKRGWSQLALGKQVGLPQVHISGIETGKVTPRFNTLLDLVRVLDHDLLLVPRELVPTVQALIHDYRTPGSGEEDDGERSLYASDDEEEHGDAF
jgi:transcriptional regulator with XRE-family HTH domain